MFESLCRQTERLNDTRGEVETLKQLLYKDDACETAAEREQKLVDLLKSAQADRDDLLAKQEQMASDLDDSRAANVARNDEIAQLRERIRNLEGTLDAKHAEHRQLDQELALAKDQSSGRQIEIDRLNDHLENARTKINQLEQERSLDGGDRGDLDELLDNARKDKEGLESEMADAKEQLARAKNEADRYKEQFFVLQEECKVIRNNARTRRNDLEYKIANLTGEKEKLEGQLVQFQQAVDDLQMQLKCQTDDKRQLSTVLAEAQRNLNESEARIVALEADMDEMKRIKLEQVITCFIFLLGGRFYYQF